jgi:hypothetical protein
MFSGEVAKGVSNMCKKCNFPENKAFNPIAKCNDVSEAEEKSIGTKMFFTVSI